MTKQELSALIDKVVGTKGIMRASVWWVKRMLNQIVEYLQSYTDSAVKMVSRTDTEMSDTSSNAVANKVIKEYVDNSIVPTLIEVTYNELVRLRRFGNLVTGQKYRITDYETKTVSYAVGTPAVGMGTAGFLFDVIVTALSPYELSPYAEACTTKRTNTIQTYAYVYPEKWKIMYSLDNDTNLLPNADTTNGKGVIYHMIDEYGNEAPYDFKNILFNVDNIATEEGFSSVLTHDSAEGASMFVYTFSLICRHNFDSDLEVIDYSKLGYCRNMKIGQKSYRCVTLIAGNHPWDSTANPPAIMRDVRIGSECTNIILKNCGSYEQNDISAICYIGNQCENIKITSSYGVSIGDSCYNIELTDCFITIGSECYNIKLINSNPSYFNVNTKIGNLCHDINCPNSYDNEIGAGCYNINECSYCRFGKGCYNISSVSGSIFGSYCRDITNVENGVFGDTCNRINITYAKYGGQNGIMRFGDNCALINISCYSGHISFGDKCYNIEIDVSDNIFLRNVFFSSFCEHIRLEPLVEPTEFSYIDNYHITNIKGSEYSLVPIKVQPSDDVHYVTTKNGEVVAFTISDILNT